jgi:hypothetical protein
MKEWNMQKAVCNEGAEAEIKLSDNDGFAQASPQCPISIMSGVSTRRQWIFGESLGDLLQARGVLNGAARRAT